MEEKPGIYRSWREAARAALVVGVYYLAGVLLAVMGWYAVSALVHR